MDVDDRVAVWRSLPMVNGLTVIWSFRGLSVGERSKCCRFTLTWNAAEWLLDGLRGPRDVQPDGGTVFI